MRVLVAALEVLGLLLVAAGLGGVVMALLGMWPETAPWAPWGGLLAAGVVVLAGAARADALTTKGGSDGAAVRSPGPTV